LFYESHQAQWLTGSYPLAQLLEEPQAQHSNFTTLVTRLLQGAATAEGSPPNALVPLPSEAGNKPEALPTSRAAQRVEPQATLPVAPSTQSFDEARTTPATGTPAAAMAADPELASDLKTLLQQQLDLGATQRLVMHGELWPQQNFQWEVERDGRHSGPQGDDDPNWTTQLALTMPVLGTVGARLQITPDGVRIALMAEAPGTGQRMREHASELNEALETSGLRLLSLHIVGGEAPVAATDG
jgi:hypothetical protein